MTTDDMKNAWRDTARGLDNAAASPTDMSRITNRRSMTALDRLANRYLRFSLIAVIAAPLSFIFLNRTVFPFAHGEWLAIAFAAFFLLASAIDAWLFQRIGRIDCRTMSVNEVITRAMDVRRSHLRAMMALIPMAACLIGFYAWLVGGDIEILLGMAAGAAVGLTLGLRVFRRFMADYRDLADA